jgi:hypothetical protein
MLRIQTSANGEVVFTLCGQLDEEHISELETLIRAEANGSIVGREAIGFLERCEADSITLKNCAGTSASGSRDLEANVSA